MSVKTKTIAMRIPTPVLSKFDRAVKGHGLSRSVATRLLMKAFIEGRVTLSLEDKPTK